MSNSARPPAGHTKIKGPTDFKRATVHTWLTLALYYSVGLLTTPPYIAYKIGKGKIIIILVAFLISSLVMGCSVGSRRPPTSTRGLRFYLGICVCVGSGIWGCHSKTPAYCTHYVFLFTKRINEVDA
jgi:hypothetical protein